MQVPTLVLADDEGAFGVASQLHHRRHGGEVLAREVREDRDTQELGLDLLACDCSIHTLVIGHTS